MKQEKENLIPPEVWQRLSGASLLGAS
jgi:hypothetical protein